MDRTASRKRLRRAGAALLVAVLLGALLVTAAPASANTGARDRMHSLTNKARVQRSIAGVKLNAKLSRYALEHSKRMARREKLFHSDPVDLRKALSSYRWSSYGENVGMTGGTLADVHRAFMNSSLHRRNVLKRPFRRVGIGAVRIDGVWWVTVVFYG